MTLVIQVGKSQVFAKGFKHEESGNLGTILAQIRQMLITVIVLLYLMDTQWFAKGGPELFWINYFLKWLLTTLFIASVVTKKWG